MTSADNANYLTVEVFDAKMESLLSTIRLENEKLRNELHGEIEDVKNTLHEEIQAVKTTLHEEIQDLRADVKVNSAQIADLQTSVYWGFAIMGIVFAIVSIAVAVISLFKGDKQEKKQSLSEQKVTEVKTLIRDNFAQPTVR